MHQDKHAALVLIHGLLSSPQEFALLARPFTSKGIILVSLNVSGYTAHAHHKPNAWRDWVDAAVEAINEQVPADQPIVLGGLCVGGALAAALALQLPHRVKRLILLSPSFTFDGWGLSRWRHLRGLGYLLGLGRHIHVAERAPYGIKNPKIRKWVVKQMRENHQSAVGPSRLPLWAIHESEK